MYLDKNLLEKALEIVRLIIKNEPFNEEAYRNAMAIYHEFGNTAAIIRLFEQCKQQLAREYGLEPSQETVRYFNTLIQPSR
jgi:DNA-binding SARP family transcriptional activator